MQFLASAPNFRGQLTPPSWSDLTGSGESAWPRGSMNDNQGFRRWPVKIFHTMAEVTDELRVVVCLSNFRPRIQLPCRNHKTQLARWKCSLLVTGRPNNKVTMVTSAILATRVHFWLRLPLHCYTHIWLGMTCQWGMHIDTPLWISVFSLVTNYRKWQWHRNELKVGGYWSSAKVGGGTDPATSAGNFFLVVPLHFFGCKSTMSFWWTLSWRSAQFGQFLVCCSSTRGAPPRAQPFVKVWGTCPVPYGV